VFAVFFIALLTVIDNDLTLIYVFLACEIVIMFLYVNCNTHL